MPSLLTSVYPAKIDARKLAREAKGGCSARSGTTRAGACAIGGGYAERLDTWGGILGVCGSGPNGLPLWDTVASVHRSGTRFPLETHAKDMMDYLLEACEEVAKDDIFDLGAPRKEQLKVSLVEACEDIDDADGTIIDGGSTRECDPTVPGARVVLVPPAKDIEDYLREAWEDEDASGPGIACPTRRLTWLGA